jgi:hypothetical protein
VAQGWTIDPTADTITFYDAPVAGANNIVVKEYASGGTGATDVFALSAWNPGFGWPQEVEFFADRLVFARTATQPQSVWFSQVSDYSNFGKSTPIADSDAITATLNARQQNAIEELVPLDKLLMLTSGGEWKTSGGQDDVLTPSTLAWKPQSYWGASKLPALVIGNTALFTQARGYIVRDIGYQFETDGYSGSDLTIFSSHLVIRYQLLDWDFQTIPYSSVWIVRNDGVALSCTYMKEQGVNGWAPHETLGKFESVQCVPEGNEDFAYFVVNRTIGGVQQRYIERLNTRMFGHARDWFFVDCGLTYDGRNTSVTTVTLATIGAGGWTDDDTLRATASTPIFTGLSDVGDWLVIDYEGDPLRMEIVGYVSTTQVDVRPLRNVPVTWQAVATTNWAIGRDTISGLGHLEGETVAILADAFVMASRAVSGGTITLDNPAVVVHAGLPYTSDFETLSVNAPGGESIRAKAKVIKKVNLLVEQGRNIKVGTTFDRLEEYESRDNEDPQQPPDIINDLVEIYTSDNWNMNGRVCVRQDEPLALSIVGVIPEVDVGR